MKHVVLAAMATLGLGVTSALAADYPSKDIQGVIQWGAGGSTDTVMRSVTPHAEDVLGGTVVMQNMTGAVGAIGLNYVANAKDDGYTLLMGAENPLLYKVMGLGTKDYSDFVPVSILARGTPILVARPDAPFDDYKGMIDYVRAHPGEIRIGSTGPGGVPSVVTAMMNTVEGKLDMIAVPYDGDGPALTALQGGAIDVMPAVLGAAIESIKGGKMKPIAVIDTEATPLLPDVPPVTKFSEGYSTYLPWGPFFGVFVKKGTPDDIVAKLSDAYDKGAQNADFKTLMDNRGYTVMGISGTAAEAFLGKWQSTTTWLLQDAGLAKNSPEKFGIPKPAK